MEALLLRAGLSSTSRMFCARYNAPRLRLAFLLQDPRLLSALNGTFYFREFPHHLMYSGNSDSRGMPYSRARRNSPLHAGLRAALTEASASAAD